MRSGLDSRGAGGYALQVLLLAGAYVATAKLGLGLAFENSSVTAIWAPTGISLAALIVWGPRLWPGVALGALLANSWTGVPPGTVLGITAGNTLEALVGAHLLVRVARFRPSLDRPRDVVALVGLGAVASTTVSATVGVTSLSLGGEIDGSHASVWRTWWLGDMGGDLLVAPALLVAASHRPLMAGPGRWPEAVALIAVTLGLSILVFAQGSLATFVIYPMLVAAALRLWHAGAVAASLVAAAVAVVFTAEGSGPFAVDSPDESLLLAQLFTGVGGVMALLLAVVVRQRRLAELALAEAEKRFRSTFHDAPIGMAMVGIEPGGGEIVHTNRSLGRITGYPPEELVGRSLASLSVPEARGDSERTIGELLRGVVSSVSFEDRYRTAGGGDAWVWVSGSLVNGHDGRPLHAIVQVEDIADRKRFEADLRYLADHDPLTGLYNRRRFAEELDRELARGAREERPTAIACLDLDHFKYVNDSFGHRAGDALIVSVAEALRRRLRRTDVLCRLGGDEFAVVLPGADAAQARAVVGQLLETVRAVEPMPARARRATASAGITVREAGDETSVEELLVQADVAMYEAKETGRDRLVGFRKGSEYRRLMEAGMTWSSRLQRALDQRGLSLWWQPIRELATGRVSQFELLLRLTDEAGVVHPPDRFLPAAERFGLIRTVDRWVLGETVRLMSAQRAAGRPVIVEVNLSGESITDPELPATIERMLAAAEIDPSLLVFEVTETTAIAHMHLASEFARRMTGLGCHFALDDFGSGFGSFHYLKHLPCDYLKIDGEFIRGLPTSRTDRTLVSAMVHAARGLGMRTIAEFANEEAVIRAAAELGVDYVQGYAVGVPEPVPEPAAPLIADPRRR